MLDQERKKMGYFFVTVVTFFTVFAVFGAKNWLNFLFPKRDSGSESESESESDSESNSEYSYENECNHPMSQEEMERLEYSDDISDAESVSTPFVDYSHNDDVVTDDRPCYMKDFYEETELSPRWCKLSEEEKERRLDSELEEYMSKK